MAKVVVLGSQGQLASEIKSRKIQDSSYRFVPKEELSTENFDVLSKLLTAERPDFVINCTAYTAVDKAETNRDECARLNRDFVGVLARASTELGFHLTHFSTDYVFNGQGTRPYAESDPTDPVNYYGQAKLEGELLIAEHAHSATIVRTSWVYSRYGANFVKTMLRLADQPNPLRVVADQKGCPTWAADLAQLAIGPLLEKTGEVQLLHFSGEGETTWHGFAEKIMTTWGKSKTITPITTSDFPTPAKRPAYSVMSKDKIKNVYNIAVPTWEESLDRCRSEWELG